MRPKVLLSGYYGFDNFGDESILELLVQNLASIGCDINILSKNPKKTFLLHAVNSSQSFSFFNLIKQLQWCDVLLSGGGSLLQDSTSVKSLVYYLFVIFLAKLFGKKVIIFAQGIGPIHNKLAFFLASLILKKCDYVSVRDEKSLFLLRGVGMMPDLVNDPVWSLKIESQVHENIVGIQLRGWKYLTESYIAELARIVAINFSDKNIKIFSLQDSIDLEVCRKFENYLKLRSPKIQSEIISNQTHDYLIKSFSKLEYLIAMRYHACLVGLKCGVKTLALNYDEKVEKLSRMAQIPCAPLDDPQKLQYYVDMMKELERKDIVAWANGVTYSFEKVNSHILAWTK